MAKSIRIATLLAVIFGLIGIFGIGHIYLRRFRMGVVLIGISVLFYFITLNPINQIWKLIELPEDQLQAAKGDGTAQGRLIVLLFWGIIYIVFFIWQIRDVRRIARQIRSSTYYGDTFSG